MLTLTEYIKNFSLTDKFLLICVAFLPLALVSGPFLPDFLISLSAIIFVFTVLRKDLKFFFFNNYSYFFFIFWGYLSVRSLFTSEIYFSLKSSLPYIRFFLCSLVSFYLIKKYGKKVIYIIFIITFLSILFVILDTLIQYSFGKDIFGYPKLQHRLGGPFGNELVVGSYLAKVSPLLIITYLILKDELIKQIPLKIIYSFSLISIPIFLSGERTSFFIFLFFLFLFLFFAKYKHKLKNFAYITLLVIFILSLILTFDKNSQDRMVRIFACQMNIKTFMVDDCKNFWKNQKNENEIVFFSTTHEAHFLTAINIFKDNKIFGIGPKMFRKRCSNEKYKVDEGCTTHPHNLLLQILSETGLVGFIFFAVLIFYIYKKLFIFGKKILKNASNSFETIQFLLLAMMAQSLFFLVPTGQFFNNWNASIIYLPLGIYLSYVLKKN